MLTQTELKLLIDGCEAYLAGNDDHQNGFCYWFQKWLERNGEAICGDSRGYGIVENFDISTWLEPGSIYVDRTEGRTEAREQFVRELHEAACFRAEVFL